MVRHKSSTNIMVLPTGWVPLKRNTSHHLNDCLKYAIILYLIYFYYIIKNLPSSEFGDVFLLKMQVIW